MHTTKMYLRFEKNFDDINKYTVPNFFYYYY